MHEIIEDVFMLAADFMHNSGILMDDDFVGKPQDLSGILRHTIVLRYSRCSSSSNDLIVRARKSSSYV